MKKLRVMALPVVAICFSACEPKLGDRTAANPREFAVIDVTKIVPSYEIDGTIRSAQFDDYLRVYQPRDGGQPGQSLHWTYTWRQVDHIFYGRFVTKTHFSGQQTRRFPKWLSGTYCEDSQSVEGDVTAPRTWQFYVYLAEGVVPCDNALKPGEKWYSEKFLPHNYITW